MNIAELFVNLGVKGSEKTIGALQATKGKLSDIKSEGFAAKAAILGAIYGFQQLMAKSGAAGTNLSQFSSLTGLNVKTLQQWTYAAQQAGVANEEFQGSVKSVYDTMAKMRLNKGAPEGMGLVATTLGFSKEDMQRAQKDVFFLMSKLQEFSKTKVPLDIQNQAMKSFGLSEGTIAAMRKGVFNEKNFASAPLYGAGQIEQLNKVDVAWKNLGTKVEMAFGKFNAKHGMQLVKDLGDITMGVIKLADALTSLADKLEVFKIFSTSVDGLTKLMRLASGESLDSIMKDDKGKMKGGRRFGQGTWWMNMIEGAQDKLLDWDVQTKTLNMDAERQWRKDQGGGRSTTVNVNQNLNFQHDGKDAKKTGDSVNKSVRDAWKQMSAQSQGS